MSYRRLVASFRGLVLGPHAFLAMATLIRVEEEERNFPLVSTGRYVDRRSTAHDLTFSNPIPNYDTPRPVMVTPQAHQVRG